MFLLPIGHDQSLRRFPWLTLALILLCALVQLHRSLYAPSDREISAHLAIRHNVEQEILATHDRADALPDQQQTFLDAFSDGKIVPPDDSLFLRLKRVETAERALLARDLGLLFAYRPVSGLSLGLVLHAFAHSGWMHLLGNMLFLWLTGCNLEDRWGRLPFGLLFLTGAIASGLTFALWHPGSHTALMGASGAVAAAMGAFLICFAATEIRFVYLFFFPFPRWGSFTARALIALPFWFLQQALQSWIESFTNTGVAYSAHVGGFLFGLAVALTLKYTGLEARYLLPKTAKGVEWEEDPEFLRALDLIQAGQRAEALVLLRGLYTRNPRHAGVERELQRISILQGDRSAARATTSAVIVRLAQEQQYAEILACYGETTQQMPDLPLTDRALAQVVRAAVETIRPPIAIEAAERLVREHAASPLIPGALWQAATAEEQRGRREQAINTLERIVEGFPLDPFADQARRRLETLRADAAADLPLAL